jgi:hypothetical protein
MARAAAALLLQPSTRLVALSDADAQMMKANILVSERFDRLTTINNQHRLFLFVTHTSRICSNFERVVRSPALKPARAIVCRAYPP